MCIRDRYTKAALEFGIEVSEKRLHEKPLNNAWNNWMTKQGVDHSQHSNSEIEYSKIRQAIELIDFMRQE